jgi:hypothetical protein
MMDTLIVSPVHNNGALDDPGLFCVGAELEISAANSVVSGRRNKNAG